MAGGIDFTTLGMSTTASARSFRYCGVVSPARRGHISPDPGASANLMYRRFPWMPTQHNEVREEEGEKVHHCSDHQKSLGLI